MAWIPSWHSCPVSNSLSLFSCSVYENSRYIVMANRHTDTPLDGSLACPRDL